MSKGRVTSIEAIRQRRPLEAAAIAQMTVEQRALLAATICDAMAGRPSPPARRRGALVLAALVLVGGLAAVALYLF